MNYSFQEIQFLLDQAVLKRYFSGASLLIFYQGEVLLHQEAGMNSWKIEDLTPHPVNKRTLFDLASLTKPLATTQLIALFAQKGMFSLQSRVGELLNPVCPEDRLSDELSATSLHALLNHSSGLPAWKPYYAKLSPDHQSSSKQLIYQFIHQEPFIYPPGTRQVYSDIGFILLGEILEKQTGNNLDQLFQKEIVLPLGAKDIGFIPLNICGGLERNVDLFGKSREFMATEKSVARNKVIQGEVHDDNAYAMGGVAGHAGLFGTAMGVYGCFREWTCACYGKGKLLSLSTVEKFIGKDFFPGEWGLGWMFPSQPSSSGSYFSKHSFGHLGFTGTSIWFDPVVDLGVIFLSNRVHPTSGNNGLKEFRPQLHDLIYKKVIHEKT